MRYCSHPRSQAIMLFATSIVLGALLLSACGQVVQGAAPNTTATSPLRAPFTLNGAIEQISQERWVVAGTPVILGPQTVITGAPARGAIAHIRGVLTADGALLAESITVDAPAAARTRTPAPTVFPTATSPPVPTLTPLPPGTVVNINGVIEKITITNNVTIIVKRITYVLPRNFVLILGKRLRVGVPIVFVGQEDTTGQIIILNVIQINHQVIIVNPPRHHREDDDEDDD